MRLTSKIKCLNHNNLTSWLIIHNQIYINSVSQDWCFITCINKTKHALTFISNHFNVSLTYLKDKNIHYNNVIWASYRLKSLATWMFVQQLVQFNWKENNKTMHNWPSLRWLPQWQFFGSFSHKCLVINVSQFQYMMSSYTIFKRVH